MRVGAAILNTLRTLATESDEKNAGRIGQLGMFSGLNLWSDRGAMGKSEASSTPQAGLGVYPRTIEAVPPVDERPLLPSVHFSKKVLSGLRIFAINFVIFAVLAELASLIYINVTKWPGSKPSYQVGYNDFSADINPAFGAWHRPNGHFIHNPGATA